MAREVESDVDEVRERRRERPRKAKRARPPIPRTEAEIDAPDRLTLSMLGVMAVVTIALWLFARMACNYHPPRETRRPRAVKLEELARDPKDAALEMQQRLLQVDYKGALELATGDVAREVEKQLSACNAQPQDCATRKKKHEKSVQSVAALLERTPTNATARVTSNTPGGKVVTIAKLERQGPIWKVVSRVPDDGSFKAAPAPQPVQPVPLASGAVSPSPSASVIRISPFAQKMVPKTAAPPPAPAPAPAASQ